MRHESRAVLLSSFGALPGMLATFVLLAGNDHSARAKVTLIVLVLATWGTFAWKLHTHVLRPLQSLASLLGALGEGDFSIRAKGGTQRDALGQVILEANCLADCMQSQQLRALEATALLRKVMDEIDVAILAFDADQRVKFANPAAERLLVTPVERLIGRSAGEIGLGELLDVGVPCTLELGLPSGPGPWEVRRREFRQAGLPHCLLMISNLQRALREEERAAWKRLLRVLGHEINNSLTPIQSLAQSLLDIMRRSAPSAARDQDLVDGLNVIGRRAASLTRFMDSYAKLARLPPPILRPVQLAALVQRAAGLEQRVPIHVVSPGDVLVQADGDQLEQALINLIKNAADACLATGSAIEIRMELAHRDVVIRILDNGPGLGETNNLFVPFFTTKPGGTGIGLVLARQIAEAHGGTLTLRNRRDAPGCEAALSLPAH